MTAPRREETIDGTIRALTIAGHGADPVFRVDVSTERGPILLRFVGYRSIPGFRVGRGISVTGRVASTPEGNTVFNPSYVLEGEHS